MRRGTVILAAVLIVLAGIGIAVGAYNAGEAHGVAQQIQTLESTAPSGSEVVRVVGPDYLHGYAHGGWGPGHGGFFPFGLLIFPLFVIGVILLVRSLAWRGGGWGPGRGWGPSGEGHGPGGWGRGGPGEEWRSRAEAWHREMHESGDRASEPEAETPPAPA
jgi:hypothetical protein